MIARLPRFAELTLQTICAKADALCHRVDEDESGWDFLVQLPLKPHDGPADTHPPRSSAFVQVKSTTRKDLGCRVKLSNALIAAQSPQPWFVILFVKSANSVKLYAVHVWEDLIRRSLEAVRRAEIRKHPLNRRWFTIPFDKRDHRKRDELVRWMQACIDAVGPEYDVAKRAISKSVGYEQGYGVGSLTVEASTEEELFQNFLGLGSGLRITDFKFTPARFGIASTKPEIDVASGVVHITPESGRDIEVRLRSAASSPPIVLAGKGYGLGLPGLPRVKQRVRFSAGFIEIVGAPSGKLSCSAYLDPQEKYDLAIIGDFATVNVWAAAGKIDLQVWTEGKRMLVGTVTITSGKPAADWQTLASSVALLRTIGSSARHEKIRVSLHDLALSSGLKTFTEIEEAPSFLLEFNHTADLPEKITSILYWFHLDVAEHAFYALVERTNVEESQSEGKRRVIARGRRVLESYVLSKPSEAERFMIRKDYERHLARLKETGSPLELEDLREFIAATAASNAP